MLVLGLLGLVIVNGLTVLAFWQDKAAARTGDRRIPEAHLLKMALIGGTPGAFLARQLFRHKTRKQPFSDLLILIALVQLCAILAYCRFGIQ